MSDPIARIRSRRTSALLIAALAASAGAPAAIATTISIPSPNFQVENSVGTSGPIGTDGFEFFNYGDGASGSLSTYTASNTLSPVAYATIGIASGSSFKYTGATTYSQLSINGGAAQHTGILFYTLTTGDGTLVTVTLSGSVPANFQIGLLDDNTAGNTNDTTFTVFDVSGGVTVASATNTDTGSVNGVTNDFYFFDVSGAQAGDQLVISGVPKSNVASLGGITFDTIPAPEPTALALLVAAAPACLRRRPWRKEPDATQE